MNVNIQLDERDVDDLLDLLRMRGGRDPFRSSDWRNSIADRIEDQRENYVARHVIALSGLPAAGKSHVARTLADVYDAPVISMGDAIRDHAPDEVRGDSKALGVFAAETRLEDPETIPGWTVDLARDQQSEVVIIDGVRSVTDYDVLTREFDNFRLVHITAPFYARLQRIKLRNRDGEGTFGPVELAERDENELYTLGVAELLDQREPDMELVNDGGPNKLAVRLRELVRFEDLPPDPPNETVLAQLSYGE